MISCIYICISYMQLTKGKNEKEKRTRYEGVKWKVKEMRTREREREEIHRRNRIEENKEWNIESKITVILFALLSFLDFSLVWLFTSRVKKKITIQIPWNCKFNWFVDQCVYVIHCTLSLTIKTILLSRYYIFNFAECERRRRKGRKI